MDYWKLNEISRFDAFPMSQVDELLDQLIAARLFTILDLTKGYWRFPCLQSPGKKSPSPFTCDSSICCPSHLPMPHGMNAASTRCVCRCLPRWCHYPSWHLGRATPVGGSGAHHWLLHHCHYLLAQITSSHDQLDVKKCLFSDSDLQGTQLLLFLVVKKKLAIRNQHLLTF